MLSQENLGHHEVQSTFKSVSQWLNTLIYLCHKLYNKITHNVTVCSNTRRHSILHNIRGTQKELPVLYIVTFLIYGNTRNHYVSKVHEHSVSLFVAATVSLNSR